MAFVMLFTGVALGVGLCVALRRFYGPRERYLNPQLHEGPFEMRRLRGATVWRVVLHPQAVPDVSPGHTHRVWECTITDSLAHVDVCFCKAQRYGVFGQWREPANV